MEDPRDMLFGAGSGFEIEPIVESFLLPAASLSMGHRLMTEALEALGARLESRLRSNAAAGTNQGTPGTPESPGEPTTIVELLLVGGAAGMLAGILDPDRTTTDCDVLLYQPPWVREQVEALAAEVAGEFGLAENWLNAAGAAWAAAMPPGWESRRRLVLAHGALRVHAVGRIDLVALKLVAGRPQDIEDLESMAIAAEEFDLLREHFAAWSDDAWPSGAIESARELLEILAASPTSDPATTALRKQDFLDGIPLRLDAPGERPGRPEVAP